MEKIELVSTAAALGTQRLRLEDAARTAMEERDRANETVRNLTASFDSATMNFYVSVLASGGTLSFMGEDHDSILALAFEELQARNPEIPEEVLIEECIRDEDREALARGRALRAKGKDQIEGESSKIQVEITTDDVLEANKDLAVHQEPTTGGETSTLQVAGNNYFQSLLMESYNPELESFDLDNFDELYGDLSDIFPLSGSLPMVGTSAIVTSSTIVSIPTSGVQVDPPVVPSSIVELGGSSQPGPGEKMIEALDFETGGSQQESTTASGALATPPVGGDGGETKEEVPEAKEKNATPSGSSGKQIKKEKTPVRPKKLPTSGGKGSGKKGKKTGLFGLDIDPK